MQPIKRIQTFHDRYPLVGPVFWMLSVQYYITQLVVGLAFHGSYSVRLNTISDLGNTACGLYGGRIVCSPLHNWMNASFIVLGLTMISGSALIYHEFKKSRASRLAFIFMALAGAGTLVVGLFPENTISLAHESGAALPFLLGNIALVLFGSLLDMPKRLRIYTVASGATALVALVLFVANAYLGLGIGGMERVVAYPQTIWLMVFGMYISNNRYRRAQKPN